MQLHFVGKNIDITDALKNYASERLKPLERKFSQLSKIDVVFRVENILQIAEATTHFNSHEIHASAESHDMYQSIDALVDKLATQITKQKEKVIDHHR